VSLPHEHEFSGAMKSLSNAIFCAITAVALLVPVHLCPQSPTPSRVGEDLSSASVASSDLQAEAPELSEKDDSANYIREWVTVSWRPDDPIYLYVVRPRNIAKPPVVVYLYDYPSETDIFRDDDWCEHTTAVGYAAVGFVPALTGHRYHDRPMKEWFVSQLQESLAKSSHDVEMVLNYLAQRGDVDIDHVGVFGVGAGATIAVMAASADGRIKALDIIDPWGDWPLWMAHSDVVPDEERPAYLKPEFLNKIAGFDPVALLPKLKTPQLRLTELSDSGTPIEARERIAASLPSQAKRVQPSGAQLDVMAASNGRTFDWLKEQLKPTDILPAKAEAKPATKSATR
jgi:cephalosporin-C deacetylase-like acetyl esterase